MNPFLALNMPNGLELFILFGLVLILFGAKKLPELARGLGQAMNEFRKAKDDLDTAAVFAKLKQLGGKAEDKDGE
jgi:sec-independent protein translocase protein TatA